MNDPLPSISIVDSLLLHADKKASVPAFIFPKNGSNEEVILPYSELFSRSIALACQLQSLDAHGKQVLLLFPTGPDYIIAFWACLLAGAVAVPAYPPRPRKPAPRVERIAKDSMAQFVLSTSVIKRDMQSFIDEMPSLGNSVWITTDEIDNPRSFEGWNKPKIYEQDLAFIQYTSGSTTEPKGVMVSHGNLLHNLNLLNEGFHLDPKKNIGVSWLPLYHDMGLIGGVLQSVYSGGTSYLIPQTSFAMDPLCWLKTISEKKGVISGGPSFAYEWCLQRISEVEDRSLDLSGWETAFCGAEPIRANVLDQFAERFSKCGFNANAFAPSYGLAEATLVVSSHNNGSVFTRLVLDQQSLAENKFHIAPLDAANLKSDPIVGCGKVLGDNLVKIVDPKTSKIASPDEIGEIWLAGPSVTQGYWNQPEITEITFKANIPGDQKQYLRTGDLGFIFQDELYITGRIKDLIILSGKNYYPSDIEYLAEHSHPLLQPNASAAFTIDENGKGKLVLVAEVRSSNLIGNLEEVEQAIREAVFGELEINVDIIVLIKPARLPKTSSGKIQRGLCRQNYLDRELPAIITFRLPEKIISEYNVRSENKSSNVLEFILKTWYEIHGVPIRADDDFFRLGGDSLQAAWLISRIQAQYSVEMAIEDLFDIRTPQKLTQHIRSLIESGVIQPTQKIQPQDHNLPYPLSSAQERIWLANAMKPGSTFYNIPLATQINGNIDLAYLELSLNQIMDRQTSLRTKFVTKSGRPMQIIEPNCALKLEIVDFRDLPEADRLDAGKKYLAQVASAPLDVFTPPLAKATVVRLEESSCLFLLVVHHLVMDAWSIGIIFRELKELYLGNLLNQNSNLPQLPAQYVDFSVSDLNSLSETRMTELRKYWEKRLDKVPVLELPADHIRAPSLSSRGYDQIIEFDVDLSKKIKDFCLQEEITSAVLLLGTFAILLHRYSGQTDFAVGMPTANRRWIAIEGLVGTFVNLLAIRSELSKEVRVKDYLSRLKQIVFDALKHQEMPFQRLITDLAIDRSPGDYPLVQVMFNYINVPIPRLEIPGLTIEPIQISNGGSQFELSMTVVDTPAQHQLSLEYNSDIFEDASIKRMLEHYLALLHSILADPSQLISDLQMLTQNDIYLLTREFNPPSTRLPIEHCTYQLIEKQAQNDPTSIAVMDDESNFTYYELNRASNQMGRYLQKFGIKQGSLVAVCLDRSIWILPVLLGIQKAGAAYLPIDPHYPRNYILNILSESECHCIVTDEAFLNYFQNAVPNIICLDRDLPAIKAENPENLNYPVSLNDIVYTIYTSGSSGKPKGVQVEHHSLTNILIDVSKRLGISHQDRLLAITSLSFDISYLELYLPLLVGAQVYIVRRSTTLEDARLADQLIRLRPTYFQATPSTYKLLLESGWKGANNLTLLCGGEKLDNELADSLIKRSKCVWNMYGPTETTIWSTMAKVEEGKPVTIGRPIANTQVYIMGADLDLKPIGVSGELFIGGTGLARGYYNNSDLTNARFITNPFDSSSKLYRTGDIGRFQQDGTIELFGRIDTQVKVRGYRIEVEQIQQILRQHPSIQDALVVPKKNEVDLPILVSYVVTATNSKSLRQEISAFLSDKLPHYMVPAAIIFLNEFPYTIGGKIDIKALPNSTSEDFLTQDYIEPRDEIERKLTAIWESVLGIQPIGIKDNFFDLGGHSLLAVRLFADISQEFHKDLPTASILENPTVESLAEIIRTLKTDLNWKSLVPIRPIGSRSPIFLVHPAGGDIVSFNIWANLIKPEYPVYGLQPAILNSGNPPLDNIEDIAAHYLEEIRSVLPHGPYFLGGYCAGGIIAFEIAQQLASQKEAIGLLAVINQSPYDSDYYRPKFNFPFIKSFLKNLPYWLNDFFQLDRKEMANRIYTWGLLVRYRLTLQLGLSDVSEFDFQKLENQAIALLIAKFPLVRREQARAYFQSFYEALHNYRSKIYPGKITVFRTERQPLICSFDASLGWSKLAEKGVKVLSITGSTTSIFEDANARCFASLLENELDSFYEISGSTSR